MKKCSNCDIEMIDGRLYGKPRFIDMDHDIDKFYVDVKTGNKSTFLGLNETKRTELKVKICPNCGKVEMFINLEDIKNR